MAKCNSTTHWAGCDCVIAKLQAFRRWMKDLRRITTTLRFYADGYQDGGCMAGLTLVAVGGSIEAMEEQEREANGAPLS